MSKKKTENTDRETPTCPKCGAATKLARNRQDVIDEYACPKCGTTVNVRVDK